MAKALDAALDAAAAECDRLIADLNARIPGEELATEAQIQGVVREYVDPAKFEAAIEAAVRERLKSEPWEYKPEAIKKGKK